MAQPTPYDRQNSFTALAAANPSDPYTGADLDEEFNAVKLTIDEVLARLALIQRDDGDLANGSVGDDQLSASLALGFTPPSAWETATAYSTPYSTVFQGTEFYKCLVDHTSGTFATDLAAGKWELIASFSAVTISDGSVTTAKLAGGAVMAANIAAGTITATELHADAVTTSKILDSNVTTAKIADSNVTTAKIADNNVTLAKLATVSTARILGRQTALTGNVESLTATQATSILDVVVGDSGGGGTKGLVPAPSAGDTVARKFLRADGAFTVLPWVPNPQGRLTLTSGAPVNTSDVSAATSVYYTPYVGNVCPIYDGTQFVPYTFAELTLSLVASHSLKESYDVFAFVDSGAMLIGTGPGWSAGAVAGNVGNYVLSGTLTTGTAARGTGAGSTELQRVGGLWTNKNSMTARNGSSTYTVGANQGTYLGTIWIDATAGQITAHVTWGQNRKWGVWNAYNRLPLTLFAGDTAAAWAYSTNTTRPANNSAANAVTTLCGLPEEAIDAWYNVYVATLSVSTTTNLFSGVGINSTTAASGFKGWGSNNNAGAVAVVAPARAAHLPGIGLTAFVALENGAGSGTNNWGGNSQAGVELRARWNG